MLATIAIKCTNIEIIDCRGMEPISQILSPIVSIGCPLVVLYLRQDFRTTIGKQFAKDYPDDCMDLLSAFVAQNLSLKSVEVMSDEWRHENHESVTEICGQLSRLTQLRDLTLHLRVKDENNSLSESLRTIGLNCKQLQRLTLRLDSYRLPINGQTLDSLKSYHKLKRLDLTLFESNDDILLEPLKLCHRLTHLTLDIWEMKTKFFINCEKHWPRLQYLSIKALTLTPEWLSHIARLPALQTLVIHSLLWANKDAVKDHVFEDLFSINMAQHIKHTKTSLETTDDGNEDKDTQQSQIYAKDSLDRFGDDLCALIVSYLSLEDRFRCECVSKQFQRTVFESVVDITLSDEFIKRLSKEKRRAIEMVAINNQLLPTFGPLITRIDNIYLKDKQLLTHCHRLSQLSINSLSEVFDSTSRQLLAKNLQKFEFVYELTDNKEQLSAFVAHNQSIKSVDTLPEMCGQLSRLTQLRELRLSFGVKDGENSLSELKRLRLVLYMPIDQQLLEPLKLCHRLTHLTLSLRQMSDKLLDNCGKHWPRLQYLSISANGMTRECLDHISRLPALKMLCNPSIENPLYNEYPFIANDLKSFDGFAIHI
ncbi:unnamed protein product, partial [Medioppia subpectinata]